MIFPSKIQSFMTIFHRKLLIKKGKIFDQWMNSSIIHDNFCELIHKKCDPKSYHSDIKYHMPLNIIFSVVNTLHSQKNLLVPILYHSSYIDITWLFGSDARVNAPSVSSNWVLTLRSQSWQHIGTHNVTVCTAESGIFTA